MNMSRTGRVYHYGGTVMHYEDIAVKVAGVVLMLGDVCVVFVVLKMEDDSDTLGGGWFRHVRTIPLIIYSSTCSIYKINMSK